MRLAKEIRSRDQGYTQQGGDWFTVQAVSYSIWRCCEAWQWLKQIHLALNRIIPLIESNYFCMQGSKEQQYIFYQTISAVI